MPEQVDEITAEERALWFVPCDGCDWDFETGEGQAQCGKYFCPDLPELLDVRCPTCLFNFRTGASNSQCGEVHTCTFSHDHAPARIELFQRWLDSRESVATAIAPATEDAAPTRTAPRPP